MINSFIIKGLTCEACVKLSTMKIKKITGVREVLIDLKTGQAKIDADRAINISEIQEALKDTDYSVINP